MNKELEPYITHGDKGQILTEEFFCLSLRRKYWVIDLLIEDQNFLENALMYEQCIKAVLQHSPKESQVYKVRGVRRLHPRARAADELEQLEKESNEQDRPY